MNHGSLNAPFRPNDPSSIPIAPSCYIGKAGNDATPMRPTQSRPTAGNGQTRVPQGGYSSAAPEQLNDRKKIRELEKENRELREALKQFKDGGVSTSNAAKDKEMEMSKLSKEIENLKRKLGSKDSEVEDLRNELSILQKDANKHREEEIAKYVDQIKELKERLDGKDDEIRALKIEYEIEVERKSDLEKDNIHLREKLHSAEIAARAAPPEVDLGMAQDRQGQATIRLPLSDGILNTLSRNELDALRFLLTSALEDLMGRIFKVSSE